MAIDPELLKNSLATVASYATAIHNGMEKWRDSEPINEVVADLRAPTFTMPSVNGPIIIDGCCLASDRTVQTFVLRSIEDLIDRQRKIAQYLAILEENV